MIRDLPQARVTIVEDLTDRLLSLTLERRIDAALIATDPADRKLDSLPLYEEPFLLVVAPSHPLAGRASIATREIDPDLCCCWRRAIACAIRRLRCAARAGDAPPAPTSARPAWRTCCIWPPPATA